MKHSIDYLAFTVIHGHAPANEVELLRLARAHCLEGFNLSVHFSTGIRPGLKYTANPLPGVYMHIGKGWWLYEFTGQGCSWLTDSGLMDGVLLEYGERTTRIDICTDILTDALPVEFAQLREERKTKSFSVVQSPTGETCYIGSRSSARHCKVYRYFAPHPRAALLRIEHTLRKEDAQIAVAYLLAGNSVDRLALSLNAKYGWLHEAYNPTDSAVVPLSAYRAARDKPSTVRWIYSQVIPAIETLHKQGLIDIDSVIAELEGIKHNGA